jgi:oxalate decarboxylase/phosphoglucose isomerase-like protein (cupin superfamily)
MLTIPHLLSALSSLPLTLAVDKTTNPDLNLRLKLAATTLDRHHQLDSDSSWTYEFTTAAPIDAFRPGSVKNANAATFPALTGIDMTMAQLNLGPCAMLPPHLHPRGTNLVMGITGNTTSYMWNENGARRVTVNLTPGVMTIFPRGSLHAMQNNGMSISLSIYLVRIWR